MSAVYAILEELEQNSSRNSKLDILRRNRDNTTLQQVMKYALDPFYTFHVKQFKAPSKYTGELTLGAAMRELLALKERRVTGHAALAHLDSILSNLTEQDASVISRVVKKDLRCGVNKATVNAVWPNLVFEYPCLLASELSDKNPIKFKAYAQIKSDGMRVNFVCSNGKIDSYGRSGKPIVFFGKLDPIFQEIEEKFGGPCVCDGELVVLDDNNNVAPRKIGNGILNKAIKGTISEKEANRVQVIIWDIISLSEFEAHLSKRQYKDRFITLQHVIGALQSNRTGKVRIAETWEVNNQQEVDDLYAQALASGEEGLIIKNQCGRWENKRSKDMIKLKSVFECDLEVVEWLEGTGHNTGLLGSLTCKTSDGKIVVNVGSGYSQLERETLKPQDVIGKIVTVAYNQRISAADGTESLYLPRLVEIREDKDEADASEKVR